jgi:hypothetical protein
MYMQLKNKSKIALRITGLLALRRRWRLGVSAG